MRKKKLKIAGIKAYSSLKNYYLIHRGGLDPDLDL
jgi:hypothetical protein